MHRQYFRVFQSPPFSRILENNCFLPFNYIKTVNVKQRGFSLRWVPLQVGLSVLNLHGCARPRPSLERNNGLVSMYSSQQSVTDKSIVEEKSSSTLCKHETIPGEVPLNNCDGEQKSAPENLSRNQPDLFEDINYDDITEGDEDKLNQFKLLMLEIDVLRQDGMNVPSKMTTEEWKELFYLPSRNQRRKFLTFLFKCEMKKLGDQRKKERKRLEKLEKETKDDNELSDHMIYGFRGSTIFMRVYDTTINLYDNYRLIRAMMFGQNLIIDCGFYNDMNKMENKLCCKQLVLLFAENRISKEPFNLHFCNLKKDSFLYQLLKKNIPTLEEPDFPINIYDESYLDMFSKDKLVYLTPHCRTELKEFNHDDIYIIGAIVDRVNTHPLTLAKAKSEGLRMAKLPLDRFLDWNIGTKSLTINQVLKIMHDAQVTGDWATALKHVPKRKIRRPDEPFKDHRKPARRGSIFQPPSRFMKSY